jgi:hypothetical protein
MYMTESMAHEGRMLASENADRRKLEKANQASCNTCEKCGHSATRFGLTRCSVKKKTVNHLGTCYQFKERKLATSNQ